MTPSLSKHRAVMLSPHGVKCKVDSHFPPPPPPTEPPFAWHVAADHLVCGWTPINRRWWQQIADSVLDSPRVEPDGTWGDTIQAEMLAYMNTQASLFNQPLVGREPCSLVRYLVQQFELSLTFTGIDAHSDDFGHLIRNCRTAIRF